MKTLYLSTMGVGLGGTVIALSLVQVTSILDTWWALASIFSGGMLGLFLLGFFSKRATHTAAVIAVIAGVIVIAWMSLSPILFMQEGLKSLSSPFHANLTIVFGTTAIFLVGFLISAGWFSFRKQRIRKAN
jgi:SSS family solute:Na+ symporter